MDNAFGAGLLNGWQLSGISTFASGMPIWLGFAGPAGTNDAASAYYGTPDIRSSPTENGNQPSGLAPIYTCDPRLGGSKVGEKLLDINCIGFPAFGEIGDVLPPYDLRTPIRHEPRPHAVQELRDPRATRSFSSASGVFNIFNRAFATTGVTRTDIDLTLNTECNRTVNGVPNGVGGTVEQRVRPDRRASTSRRTRSTTSARSTSCAVTGSSSSR